MPRVYLSLGSNIAPEENLPRALRLLAERVRVLGVSRVWQTPPYGTQGAPFLNAAALIETALPAERLKREILRPIEAALGRVRGPDKFAPRPIDLDILLYSGCLPDPEVWERPHLAVPLAELLPDYENPRTGEHLAEAARRLLPPAGFFPRPDVVLRRSQDPSGLRDPAGLYAVSGKNML